MSIVNYLSSLGESDEVSHDQLDAYEWRVELVYRDLLAKEASGDLGDREREALTLVAEAHSRMRQVVESGELAPSSQAPMIPDGLVGRPRFNIN